VVVITPYLPEKWVWTAADFDRLGWHDALVHALAFLPETYELALDIDYLFQWVRPAADESYFSFWVAPCTLIFEDVAALDLALSSSAGDFAIADRTRESLPPRPGTDTPAPRTWRWHLDGHEGDIASQATGYTQYIRAAPLHIQRQRLDRAARGGLSFARGQK